MDPTAAATFPADALLAHASGLRALSRRLLDDEHAAEEVVQETWIAALERPPGSGGRLGGWLRQVARRTALDRRRGESRRAVRERDAARGESLAPIDEEVEQREVLRRVIDAVLALEEPYQSVVLMRFWQDLPPREIARRRGAPVATVNSQIQRALGQLRDRLDADADGERGRWVLALVAVSGWEGAVPPVTVGPVGQEVGAHPWIRRIAMDWRLYLGAASAVGLMGWTAAAWGPAEPTQAGAADSVGAQQEAPADAAVARAQDEVQEASSKDERAPVVGLAPDDPAPEEPVAEAAPSFVLSGVVVDQRDRPVDGVHVFVGPRLHPLNDAGETDGEGRFRIEVPAHAGRATLALALFQNGTADAGLREVEVVAGRERELRLVLRQPVLQGMHPEREGNVAYGVEEAEQGFLVRDRIAPERYEPRIPLFPAGEGRAHFQWPAFEENPILDHFETVEDHTEQVFDDRSRSGGFFFEGEEPVLVDVTEATESAEIALLGSVHDAAGEPVARSLVVLRDAEGWEYVAHTDADGAFELAFDASPWIELRAGGGDLGLAHGKIEIPMDEPPASVRWDGVLDRGLEVAGRLVEAEGTSADAWIVEYVSDSAGSLWIDGTNAMRGAFAIPNLPAGTGELHLRADLGEPLPRVVLRDVMPAVGGVVLEHKVADPGLGSVRLALSTPPEEGEAAPELRLWQVSSGRGVRARWDAEAQSFVATRLPAGRYRLSVGATLRGYRSLGEVDVRAGEETDLGAAILPASGVLEVPPLEGVGHWTLVRRSDGVESRVAYGSGMEPATLTLPAGGYVMMLPDAEGGDAELEVTVDAGETTAFERE